MKEIQLTQGKVAFVDDDDFEKVNAFKWCAHFNGWRWYAVRSIRLPNGEKTAHMMARFIMGLEYGDPREVDHKDRANTLDNRRENLRITLNQNQQNVGLRKNNTSGFKGVSWIERLGKWDAHIGVNGKLIYLDLFDTAFAAALAYDRAALYYHGEFACTNAMLGLLKKPSRSVNTLTVAA